MRERTIGDAVINLSNLIWTDTADSVWKERSVFLVQDFQNEEISSNKMNYFFISFGERRFEDGITGCVYLAVVSGDGKYMMEPMENDGLY